MRTITVDNFPEKKLAILGSTDNNTPFYAAQAKEKGLVLISDSSTSEEFTDKTTLGNVFRLSFTSSYRYSVIGNFLKSREWKVVSIIHGDKGVPPTLTAKLNVFGIRYSNVMFPKGVKEGE